METVILTCRNHRHLRWSVVDSGLGAESRFGPLMFDGDEHDPACGECACPASDLIVLEPVERDPCR